MPRLSTHRKSVSIKRNERGFFIFFFFFLFFFFWVDCVCWLAITKNLHACTIAYESNDTKYQKKNEKKAMQRSRYENLNVCVCVKDSFKLQVNSVTICNCHERRWFIESSDHLSWRERTRDNLVCLTVSSRHRTFSRSGKCFGCLSCKLLHDKSQYKGQLGQIPYQHRLPRDLGWHTLMFLPKLEKRIHITQCWQTFVLANKGVTAIHRY